MKMATEVKSFVYRKEKETKIFHQLENLLVRDYKDLDG